MLSAFQPILEEIAEEVAKDTAKSFVGRSVTKIRASSSELEATAYTPEGELMGVRHKTLPIYGVQFHPESILTETGHKLW